MEFYISKCDSYLKIYEEVLNNQKYIFSKENFTFGDAAILPFIRQFNGVNTELITNELKNIGHSNVIYEPNKENIPNTVNKLHKPGDLIITMGAGDIWRQIEKISVEISI